MELWRTIRTKVKGCGTCGAQRGRRMSLFYLLNFLCSAELTAELSMFLFSFVCVFFSQEAGWGCCHGDATPEECRGRGGRGPGKEEDQRSKKREERLAGQAHQTGRSNRQSRYTAVISKLVGFRSCPVEEVSSQKMKGELFLHKRNTHFGCTR